MTTRIVFVLGLLVLFILAVLGIRAVQQRAPIGKARYMLDNAGEVQQVIDYRRGEVWELGKGTRPATREEEEFEADRREGAQR